MTRTRLWSRYTHPERPKASRQRLTEPLAEGPASGGIVRLFVAIELDAPLLAELARIQAAMREQAPGLRYVRPEGIHCTLKFLGNLDAARQPAIQRALAAIEAPPRPDSLRLAGTGTFGGREGPRVLWCGVQGDLAGLSSLAKAVDEALSRLGFEPERQPYRPHLTLARFPEGMPHAEREALAEALSGEAPQQAEMRPRSFSLMSSRLQPGGSAHTRVAAFPLGQ